MISIVGLDKLEYLQSHNNQEVYKKAYTIIDKYFSHTDDIDEDTSLAPQQTNEQFTFSVPDSTSTDSIAGDWELWILGVRFTLL